MGFRKILLVGLFEKRPRRCWGRSSSEQSEDEVGPLKKRPSSSTSAELFTRSSNGRTAVSGTVYLGSSPSLVA